MVVNSSCQPRNVFIDLGANWCNTMCLFKSERISTNRPFWQVYAFEAAPIIAAYVESCAHQLNHNLPLLQPPLPSTGSSSDLFAVADRFGCASHPERLRCVRARILEISQNISFKYPEVSDEEVERRLLGASECVLHNSTIFKAIPRAASKDASGVEMYAVDDIFQLVRGGALPRNSGVIPKGSKASRVKSVKIATWIRESFTEEDFVVLKMDVEGAEQMLIPDLVAHGAFKLIDMLFWECHWNARYLYNFITCHRLAAMMKRNGVGKVFTAPYTDFETDTCAKGYNVNVTYSV